MGYRGPERLRAALIANAVRSVASDCSWRIRASTVVATAECDRVAQRQELQRRSVRIGHDKPCRKRQQHHPAHNYIGRRDTRACAPRGVRHTFREILS